MLEYRISNTLKILTFIQSKSRILLFSLLDLIATRKRESIFITTLNLINLYLITRLNYKKYYKALIRRKINLLVKDKESEGYREIVTTTK